MTIKLEVKKLSKYFGGLKAVSNVDMNVEEKKIIGLIGPNGAGKTTLFNMIACYFPPTEGDIVYNNRSIVNLKPHQVNQLGIARTFQVAKPFGDLTLLDNIIIGAFCKNKNRKLAKKKAEEVYELIKFSADKNKSAFNLTPADRKKLELARALATDPELLLLDEVMAGCNPHEKDELITIINDIRDKKGLTIIVIEHDIRAVVNLCDRIAMLDGGKKIIEDIPKIVANDKRVIKAYLGEEYIIAKNKKS